MKKLKRKEYTAVCTECEKKFYSKTTNFKGRIVCPSCDKQLKDLLKQYERNPFSV